MNTNHSQQTQSSLQAPQPQVERLQTAARDKEQSRQSEESELKALQDALNREKLEVERLQAALSQLQAQSGLECALERLKAAVELKIICEFKVKQFDNSWIYPDDFSVYSQISSAGSFNLGVYSIDCHNDDTYGEHALKIVLNLVDTGERDQMYGGKTNVNTNRIRRKQRNEYKIPASSPHPLIVPHNNRWIGNIEDLADDFPDILALRNELRNTNAAVIRKTNFLVMPKYEQTLTSFFAEANEQAKFYVVFQLLVVLQHFQKNFILHADFRGENILVVGNAQPDEHSIHTVQIGVADFGLAIGHCNNTRVVDWQRIIDCKNNMNQSYIPPELKRPKIEKETVLWNHVYGADSWSCGLMILELFANDVNITNDLKTEKATPKSVINQISAHKKIKEICKLLLQTNPSERNIEKALLIAGELCWPPNNELNLFEQYTNAKRMLDEIPISTAEFPKAGDKLHKLLRLKFVSSYLTAPRT